MAQNQKIDSLLRLLPKARNESKADISYELAYEYIVVDVGIALRYSKESYTTSEKIGDSLRMVKAARLLSSAYRRLELIDSAVLIAKSSLAIAERNRYKEEVKILYNSLAMAYSLKAEYDNALDYYFQSLIIREKDGSKSEISITLNNIGFVYFKIRNYEKALEYFERSLTLKKEIKDDWDLDRVLINIGLCNIHLKSFDKALESIKEGLAICGQECHEEIIIEGEFGLGVANYGLSRYEESSQHFNKSLELSVKMDNKRFQAENLVYLGRISLYSQDFQKVEELLKDAEEIATEYGYNQLLIDTYKEYAKYYNQARDFEKASIYQDKYITLKDALIGEELVKNISRVQTQFEERKNIATIAAREEALARQRTLNVAIGIIALLAATLVFVLYRSNAVKKRVNSALSEAKEIIEQQNEVLQDHAHTLQLEVDKATTDLKRANESLTKVNEELDHFIYKTSHDIRGPLASLKGVCNVALIDVKDPLALDYLQKLDQTATKLNRILTRLLIINQINHASINPEPLDIERIVDDIILLETKKGTPSRLVFKREIQRGIAFKTDDVLMRIILENLVDNSIKFYDDSSRIEPFVLIKIWTDTRYINICVIDNGLGITDDHPDKIFQMFSRGSERSTTGGLGLYLIKQASERLGGDVTYRKTPEGYTEFTVVLPLVSAQQPVIQTER